jgi:hypothetical protein
MSVKDAGHMLVEMMHVIIVKLVFVDFLTMLLSIGSVLRVLVLHLQLIRDTQKFRPMPMG